MAKRQYGDQNGRNDPKIGAVTPRRLPERGRGEGTADWIAVDPVLIQQAIAAWAINDGALRFGYTRDGGAYSIGVYGDGDARTEYFGPNDDVEGFLRDIITAGRGD